MSIAYQKLPCRVSRVLTTCMLSFSRNRSTRLKGTAFPADIILDWRQIARWSRTLGPRVSVLQSPGGLDDLVLSRAEIREEVFRQLFEWLSARA